MCKGVDVVRFSSGLLILVTMAAAAMPQALMAQAAPPVREKPAKSVKQLISQGNAALTNQDFKAARDAFSDALSIDPRNSVAMSGLAVAYAGLKQYGKAVPLIDRAALPNPNNRLMQYNAAAVHIDANSAMRAARIVRDYLQAHPTPLDEPMANALAIALAAADEQARESSFFETASQFYQTYNARLEAAASGMKRWGIDWISAADYASKQAEPTTKPTVPTTLDCATADTLPPPGVYATALADLTGGGESATTPPSQTSPTQTPTDPTPTDPTPTDPASSNQAASNPPDSTDPQPATPTKHEALIQYAAAFPVAPDLLITAAAPLDGAKKIELTTPDGNPMKAVLVRSDEKCGLALLRLTNQTMLYLSIADDFKGGALQCAAFPTADMFNPTVEMLSGTAPAPAAEWKVRLNKHPRLPGAPLLVAGKVIGVQLGDTDALNNALPSATLAQLKTFLGTDAPAAPGTASAATVLLQLTATKSGT